MSKLLNCFGKVNALVNSNGVVLLETSTPGTYNLDLGNGIYRIALIGGGGGGGKTYWAAGHEIFYRYAKGGVGATVDMYVDVPLDCTATITVGGGGHSDSRTSGADTTATDGTGSSIIGIPNLVVSCGYGTAGNIVSKTGYPGTMGALTLSGDAILRVDMNSNEHPITSTATSGVRANTNWPTDTSRGRGGGCSAGTGGTIWGGGAGYVLIRYYNRNYFNLDDME
jgi:hypothetical protein